MGMSRCYSLMKCLLILLSIIFLCVGGGACAFAAWALWEGGAGEEAAGRAGLCALLAWGGALALGALVALGGAARGSAALLAAAVALLALTAVAEAAAAWWGAAHLPQLRLALQQRLERTVRHDYGVLPVRTTLVDSIQQGLECCGANDARDWQGSAWARGAGEASGDAAAGDALDLSVSAPAAFYYVPPSCCQVGSPRVCLARRLAPPLHECRSAEARGGGVRGGAARAGGVGRRRGAARGGVRAARAGGAGARGAGPAGGGGRAAGGARAGAAAGAGHGRARAPRHPLQGLERPSGSGDPLPPACGSVRAVRAVVARGSAASRSAPGDR